MVYSKKVVSVPIQPLAANLRIVNADLLSGLVLSLELDNSVHQSVQGIVLADTDVITGMDLSAPLTDQNVSGQDELTVRPLGAEALALTIASVPGGTNTFFMCE